jgi:hypothetical protein
LQLPVNNGFCDFWLAERGNEYARPSKKLTEKFYKWPQFFWPLGK